MEHWGRCTAAKFDVKWRDPKWTLSVIRLVSHVHSKGIHGHPWYVPMRISGEYLEALLMVWYGMVWYGMVWYGMVWYGMVWYGMVWYGMVWYGMVWYGMVWYGMVWYGMVWYGMVWYGMVWYGMVWYGMVWYGMVWSGTAFLKDTFEVIYRNPYGGPQRISLMGPREMQTVAQRLKRARTSVLRLMQRSVLRNTPRSRNHF